MNLPQAVNSVFSNYATFSTRASRSEYWYFTLFVVLAEIVLQVLDQGLNSGGVLQGLFALGTFVPQFAVAVRRMHDIGRRGRWILLGFLPVIGWIWLLILLCKPGDAGPNLYGPPPP